MNANTAGVPRVHVYTIPKKPKGMKRILRRSALRRNSQLPASAIQCQDNAGSDPCDPISRCSRGQGSGPSSPRSPQFNVLPRTGETSRAAQARPAVSGLGRDPSTKEEEGTGEEEVDTVALIHFRDEFWRECFALFQKADAI